MTKISFKKDFNKKYMNILSLRDFSIIFPIVSIFLFFLLLYIFIEFS